MPRNSILIVIVVLLGYFAAAYAEPIPDHARGELLYTNHCVACHNTKIHWRDKRIARDWKSLQAEVKRWQNVSGLGWDSDDIMAVARYLNTLYYHYPITN